MKRAVRLLIVSSVLLAGCQTAKKAAVTTFHVVDAPANYIRHKIDEPRTTTTVTTTTTSDVSNPGYPVTVPTTTPPTVTTQRRTVRSSSSTASHTPRVQPSATPRKTASNGAASSSQQFPVARPVPGRPGYVYSIDPNGGMIDVTGYKSGDKAKDPYTKQIFIVP